MQQDPHTSMTSGVIEIASNSVSLLVGTVTPKGLTRTQEESTPIEFRASVQALGGFTPEVRTAALESIRKYQVLATQQGAEHILLVGHKVVRSAENKKLFLEELQRATGLECQILSGEQVAALAFLGAISTNGADMPPDGGVLDIGPGSIEFIYEEGGRISWLTSVPKGSGWIRDQYLSSNPPTHTEVERARSFLHTFIPDALQVPQVPSSLIVTGSSAKALLNLEEQETNGDRLTGEDLQVHLQRLLQLPAESLAQRYGQPTERARLLPAGVLLVLEVMDYLHLEMCQLTSSGLPHGVLLAYARYGETWLDHLNASK